VAETWGDRPLQLVFGMLNTHDARGFLRPLAPRVAGLGGVAIEGEANALSVAEAVAAAHDVGIAAAPRASVAEAIDAATASAPEGRVLICGSLYLAGRVLVENG
jgi:dihydrofolate synthase/folylpolyglutamate synthase